MTAGSGAERGGRVRPIDLFRDRNYSGLWLSGACTGVVRWLEVLAASIFVFDVTGSAFQTALVTFFRFLPMVLLGTVVGTLAERINRRTFMLATLGILCLTSGALSVSAYTGHLAVWQVMLGICLGGALFAADFPFRRTMMGEIAGPGRAGAALAFDSVTNSATRLLGPLGAGVLYDEVGIYGAYLLCCLLYVTAFLTMLPVRYIAASPPTVRSKYLTNIMEGLQYVRRQRMIVGALLVTIITNMFVVPFSSLIPVIGKEGMSLNASLIGILASAEGIGAMIGSIAIATIQPRNFPRTYTLGTLLFMLGVIWFATLDSFSVAVAVLILTGLGHAGFSATQSSILFSAATPEMRSRVLGVLATCIGAGPFGVLNLGLLASWLGANWAIIIMTLEGMVLLAVVAAIWPELYRSPQRLSERAAE